ncbi:AMP-binding protein [Streptosporangium sp. NPDC087985]|uniref:AMP-binding protein n=1 Tax=Streptosporangium sp. NPDC087985 TaxID=3366196 RepID=UPI0037F71840
MMKPVLLELLDAWAEQCGSDAVVTDFDIARSRNSGTPHPRAALAPSSIREQVGALAAGLRREGVVRGDVVAVQLPNWHEYLVTHLALYTLGTITLPISPIYRSMDVRRQLELSEAAMLIVPMAHKQRSYVEDAVALRDELPSLSSVVVVGETGGAGDVRRWSEVLNDGRSPELEEERRSLLRGDHALGSNELMLLNFTSGTTGDPKGVMHSCATLLAGLASIARRLQLTVEDVFLVPSTLGHAAGFVNGMYLPLFLGARVVYMDDWDAGLALRIMEDCGVSYTAAMPTYLLDLLRHDDFAARDISTLSTVRVSGGPISRAMMADLHERLPNVRLCPGWGMTECLYLTSADPDDDVELRNNTDGRPFDLCQVEVRDPSSARALPEGTVGELVVRTPSMTLGYYGREDLTAAALTPDGWFKTGDLGSIRGSHLQIAGRSKDIVIRGGENIPVVAVEQLLEQHPKVRKAAVIGVADARLGERACAVVECHGQDPLTFDEMRRFFADRGATKHFIPELLVVTEELPLTPTGKIRKHELVSKYAPADDLPRAGRLAGGSRA